MNTGTGDPLSPGSGETSPSAPQRFKWVLGDSPGGHCPSCAALAGQVHTMADWEAAGATPGGSRLYCQGHCHCSLEPTDDPATGSAGDAPLRRDVGSTDEEENLMNAERSLRMAEGELPEDAELIRYLANKGWTDAARAASLAVRRAKAAARRAQREQERAGRGSGAGGADQPRNPQVDYNEGWEAESDQPDYESWFHEEGMGGMSQADIDAFTEQLRQKLAAGESLSYIEEGFLEERVDGGYAGESEGDPIFNWAERQADREWRVEEATGMNARAARGKASDLAFRRQQGETLTAAEQQFLETYEGIMSNRAPEPGARCPARQAPETSAFARPSAFAKASADKTADKGARCPARQGPGGVVANACPPSLGSSGATPGATPQGVAWSVGVVVNRGWTDEARAAALAVRRAKALQREGGELRTRMDPAVPGKGAMARTGSGADPRSLRFGAQGQAAAYPVAPGPEPKPPPWKMYPGAKRPKRP